MKLFSYWTPEKGVRFALILKQNLISPMFSGYTRAGDEETEDAPLRFAPNWRAAVILGIVAVAAFFTIGFR